MSGEGKHRGIKRQGREDRRRKDRASRATHPISRWVVGWVILILGVVGATRIEMAYLPVWTFPELEVRLSLVDAGEVEEITRRYVMPLESAVRSLGEVRGQAGEVSHRGAWLKVRFNPGIDAERKAARLESELQSLRRLLPEGASITVQPVRSRIPTS